MTEPMLKIKISAGTQEVSSKETGEDGYTFFVRIMYEGKPPIDFLSSRFFKEEADADKESFEVVDKISDAMVDPDYDRVFKVLRDYEINRYDVDEYAKQGPLQ